MLFYYWQEIPPCFDFYIVVTKYETEVMGLTPNGSEVNHICESLNYKCLSDGLGNEANIIAHDET